MGSERGFVGKRLTARRSWDAVDSAKELKSEACSARAVSSSTRTWMARAKLRRVLERDHASRHTGDKGARGWRPVRYKVAFDSAASRTHPATEGGLTCQRRDQIEVEA